MSKQTARTARGRRQDKRTGAAGRALARSRVFALLARALRYPDEELFASLRDSTWRAALAEAACRSGIGPDNAFLVELQGLPETLPADLAGLQGMHTTLFSSGNVCPHQESDYVASHAFQKADVMADIAGFYAAFGVRVSSTHRELPDFLGAELEFLHLVGWKEAQARRQSRHAAASICRKAHEKFLADHLAAWVRAFRESVERSQVGQFYILLARLTESFTKAQGVEPRFASSATLSPFGVPPESQPYSDCP